MMHARGNQIVALLGMLVLVHSALADDQLLYPDGQPAIARHRLEAKDHGRVLRHGDGPSQCDIRGARDIFVYESGGTYYMTYDGTGPKGWLTCLATSADLIHWTKKGAVLDFGKPGEIDSASASYGVTYFDGDVWHMFYLGTPYVTPAPDFLPIAYYATLKARGQSPAGPWIKQPEVVPFRPTPDTYYTDVASPGPIIKQGDEYLMFFSASCNATRRSTLGIARTNNLNGPWTVDAEPILPAEEQLENASLYYEPTNATWFLFTNHIAILDKYCDAVWVYWSKDLNRWDRHHKAVVVDGKNCTWSEQCIGVPSVIPYKGKLAVFYDAPGGDKLDHTCRDVGLAWLDLPLVPPAPE